MLQQWELIINSSQIISYQNEKLVPSLRMLTQRETVKFTGTYVQVNEYIIGGI